MNLNFKYYGHTFGGHAGYARYIMQNLYSNRLNDSTIESRFYLTSNRPALVNPFKKTIYYLDNSQGYLDENVINRYRQQLTDGINNDATMFIFCDDILIGTDKYILEEYWAAQPITLHGKPFEYLYMLVCFMKNNLLSYSLYSLRTPAGREAVENYFGSYFHESGNFDEYGLKLMVNILKLSYGNGDISVDGLKDSFAKGEIRSMNEYRAVDIHKRGATK